MIDLVEFITARLDEDEAMARTAAGVRAAFGAWHIEPWYDGTDERCDIRAGVGGDLTMHGGVEVLVATHMVRHDPARVLRDVEAKRRILAEVVAQIDQMEERSAIDWAFLGVPAARVWTTDLLLQLLAAPYADHPDYRSEWAPPSAT